MEVEIKKIYDVNIKVTKEQLEEFVWATLSIYKEKAVNGSSLETLQPIMTLKDNIMIALTEVEKVNG